jgi:ribosomal protein L12E/L44/L45/RPP1/RPP2
MKVPPDRSGHLDRTRRREDVAADLAADDQPLGEEHDEVAIDHAVHAHGVRVDDHGLVDGLAGGDVDLVLVEAQIQRRARRRGPHQDGARDAERDRPGEATGHHGKSEEEQQREARQPGHRDDQLQQSGDLVADQEEEIERHLVRSLEAEGVEPLDARRELLLHNPAEHGKGEHSEADRRDEPQRELPRRRGVRRPPEGHGRSLVEDVGEEPRLVLERDDQRATVATLHQVGLDPAELAGAEFAVDVERIGRFRGAAHSRFPPKFARSRRRARRSSVPTWFREMPRSPAIASYSSSAK